MENLLSREDSLTVQRLKFSVAESPLLLCRSSAEHCYTHIALSETKGIFHPAHAPNNQMTSSYSVMAAAFFEQFCVQGAWGVVPIHLMELSPGSFRTFVVGTSYQLGTSSNLCIPEVELLINSQRQSGQLCVIYDRVDDRGAISTSSQR